MQQQQTNLQCINIHTGLSWCISVSVLEMLLCEGPGGAGCCGVVLDVLQLSCVTW